MPKPTRWAIDLYNALKEKGIKSELETWDGYKHIDISIDEAELDIEIDGLQHLTDPRQIEADLDRAYYSMIKDNMDTLHIPNVFIDEHLDKIADAISKVVRNRIKD